MNFQISDVDILQIAEPYPITPKEHGVDSDGQKTLMDTFTKTGKYIAC